MNYQETYEKWKQALSGTIYEAELAAMSEDEREESFFQSLKFGTAGMRGVMGLGTNRLNIFTVRRAAKGLAEYVKSRRTADRGIAIAYDSRHHSEEFARETALVLAANGVRAYLFDQLQSVPLLSFAILQLGCAGGVVITASAINISGKRVFFIFSLKIFSLLSKKSNFSQQRCEAHFVLDD